jgi:hypothetical protein
MLSFSSQTHARPAPRFGDFNIIAKHGFIDATIPSFNQHNIQAKVAVGPYFHRHGENHVDEYLVPIHTENNLAALKNIMDNPESYKTVVGLHGNLQIVAKDGDSFAAQAKHSFKQNNIQAEIPDGPYGPQPDANNVAEYLRVSFLRCMDRYLDSLKPLLDKSHFLEAYLKKHPVKYLVPINTKENLAALKTIMDNPEILKTVADFQA